MYLHVHISKYRVCLIDSIQLWYLIFSHRLARILERRHLYILDLIKDRTAVGASLVAVEIKIARNPFVRLFKRSIIIIMSYEVYCKKLHDLYFAGKITYNLYRDMVKKHNKTEDEYLYLYNSVRHGC